MARTRSMTRNQNHVDASRKKRIKTCDNVGVAFWSDINHDVLFLVMMQLGVVDFLAFSGVCKSWRSLALSNRNMFMDSRLPMSIHISTHSNEKECRLVDFEGRKFKTILPHSAGRTCVGLTCGYLILFGEKTRDFWLVNPITRHELHFPAVNRVVYNGNKHIRATLVFSPSISEWVFVMLNRPLLICHKIWLSVVGKGAWTHVSTHFPIYDIHAFKGKIYTTHSVEIPCEMRFLCEMKLYPEPKLMFLRTKNFLEPDLSLPEFVSSGKNLYVMDRVSRHPFKIHELDFDKMKWVSREKPREEYAFFLSSLKRGYVGIQYGKHGSFHAKMWYFFHDCLKVNLLQE